MKIPSEARDSLGDLVKRDKKNNRFKTIVTPILVFCSVLGGVFGVSFLLDMPTFLILSYFALALVVTTTFHDHWILNSAAVPFSMLFPAALLLDFFYGTWWSVLLHVTVNIFTFIIVCQRYNTSLIIALVSSFVYAAWVYTISEWLDVPYYNVLPISPPWQFFLVLMGGIGASLGKTMLNYLWIKKGNEIKCDKGICPL